MTNKCFTEWTDEEMRLTQNAGSITSDMRNAVLALDADKIFGDDPNLPFNYDGMTRYVKVDGKFSGGVLVGFQYVIGAVGVGLPRKVFLKASSVLAYVTKLVSKTTRYDDDSDDMTRWSPERFVRYLRMVARDHYASGYLCTADDYRQAARKILATRMNMRTETVKQRREFADYLKMVGDDEAESGRECTAADYHEAARRIAQ